MRAERAGKPSRRISACRWPARVLNALNMRLDADDIAFILEHGDAKVLLTDREFSPRHRPRALACSRSSRRSSTSTTRLLGGRRRRSVRSTTRPSSPEGDPDFAGAARDEWDAIALNYTSGTTGNPKGVVYHHRGAYLNALGNIAGPGACSTHPVYLWTLPMFHCNGWCFPWTLTALAGTQCAQGGSNPA